jgi:hypothetical protein
MDIEKKEKTWSLNDFEEWILRGSHEEEILDIIELECSHLNLNFFRSDIGRLINLINRKFLVIWQINYFSILKSIFR